MCGPRQGGKGRRNVDVDIHSCYSPSSRALETVPANLLLFNLNFNMFGCLHLSGHCMYRPGDLERVLRVTETESPLENKHCKAGGMAFFPAHSHLPGRSVWESVSSKFQEL